MNRMSDQLDRPSTNSVRSGIGIHLLRHDLSKVSICEEWQQDHDGGYTSNDEYTQSKDDHQEQLHGAFNNPRLESTITLFLIFKHS